MPCPPCPCAPQPFLSSYIEAVGSTQTVGIDQSVVFDVGEDALDKVGPAIDVDETGTIFTITQPGLYHVEWTVSLRSATPPVLIGLMENGSPASAIRHEGTTGVVSSGALIHVEEVPYTVSLHNFGGAIQLENPPQALNTSASIRILRFADGPAATPAP